MNRGTTIDCRRLDRTDRRLLFLLYFVTAAVLCMMACRLNAVPVIDETGVMANAAYLAGYDWSECVFSMGNFYYKPGASLLYLPCFWLFSDPYMLYKACLTVNMLLISSSSCFAYAILRKHLLPQAEDRERGPVYDRMIPVIISLAVGFLPSAALHSMYAKTDGMLIFLAWVMTYLIYEVMDARRAGSWARIHILSVLAAFIGMYAYFTHTRGVVFIIALVMVCICMQIFTGYKVFDWIPYATSSVIFFVVQKVICEPIKAGVNVHGIDHNTLASSGLGALRQLFTYSGLCTMLKMIVGWFYEAFISTYGMVIIGLLIGLYYIVWAVKSKFDGTLLSDAAAKETAASAFGFLNFAGTFAMGCLFFFRYGIQFFSEEINDTAGDRVIFERYLVCTVGPLILLGLFYMIYRADIAGLKTRLTALGLYVLSFLLFVFYLGPWLEGRYFRVRYFISVCTFMEYRYEGATSDFLTGITAALAKAGLLAAGAFILIMAVTWLLRVGSSRRPAADTAASTEGRNERLRVVSSVAMAVAVLVYSVMILVINFKGTRLERDTFVVDRLQEIAATLNEIAERTDIDERFPYVHVGETTIDTKSFQPALPSYHVGDKKETRVKLDNYFILSEKGVFTKKYCDDDYYLLDCFDYDRVYKNMVFVKGDELAAALEAAGYGVTKYNFNK